MSAWHSEHGKIPSENGGGGTVNSGRSFSPRAGFEEVKTKRKRRGMQYVMAGFSLFMSNVFQPEKFRSENG
jgi:hypothetical protein